MRIVKGQVQLDYSKYLENHISNVKKAANWLMDNLPNMFEGKDVPLIQAIISEHDKSKYSEEEFEPYANYFYGTKTSEVEQNFDLAWLHHIHQNPHHWQHWVLVQDEDADKVLEMPFESVVEMIADWWAFSWSKGNLYEIFDWYDSQKKMKLNTSTKSLVEKFLESIRNKLEEIDNAEVK